jgi:hypothetical protein
MVQDREGGDDVGTAWFFDLDARYGALLAAGDTLEKPGGLIDFEMVQSTRSRIVSAIIGPRRGKSRCTDGTPASMPEM